MNAQNALGNLPPLKKRISNDQPFSLSRMGAIHFYTKDGKNNKARSSREK
jgi:hypothetical protein